MPWDVSPARAASSSCVQPCASRPSKHVTERLPRVRGAVLRRVGQGPPRGESRSRTPLVQSERANAVRGHPDRQARSSVRRREHPDPPGTGGTTMLRRTAATLALTTALVAAGAGAASAHECYIANRSAQGNAGASNSANWYTLRLEELYRSGHLFLGGDPLTDAQVRHRARDDGRGGHPAQLHRLRAVHHPPVDGRARGALDEVGRRQGRRPLLRRLRRRDRRHLLRCPGVLGSAPIRRRWGRCLDTDGRGGLPRGPERAIGGHRGVRGKARGNHGGSRRRPALTFRTPLSCSVRRGRGNAGPGVPDHLDPVCRPAGSR